MMMQRDFTAGYKFIADFPRKRQVGNTITVKMADFPFADPKFTSAEAVRSGRHPRPTQEFQFNGFTDFIGRCHGLNV